ncbi:MAG: hypothetical protein ACRDVE_02080 [Actinocrinis sp.]
MTSDTSSTGLAGVLRGIEQVLLAAAALEREPRTLAAHLRAALTSGDDRRDALFLLGLLDLDYTRDLVPELVGAALSHRDAGEARRALGALEADTAGELVPPAVRALLEAQPDDDAFRRMAELLDHLGLEDALAELCEAAAASEDPDIQEVAQDFGHR